MAVPLGRASAAAMFCTRKVGWTWMGLPSWATILTATGYCTFGLVCVLPLLVPLAYVFRFNSFVVNPRRFNTFWRAWRLKAVGGGTRGEPFVASLISYACSLVLSLKKDDTLWADESVWINGLGTLVCLLYMALFLYYAHQNTRWTTLVLWIPIGFVYFLLTVLLALVSESITVLQWLCTVAVLASWCIPVLLAFFVMERDVHNLPDYISSSVGLFYSIVWSFRAWYPERDYHSLGQNLVGAFCSSLFLSLLRLWTKNEQAGRQGEAGQGDGDVRQPLIGASEHVIIEFEDQKGGQQLELTVDDEPPPLVGVEPQPVLYVDEDPAPVLHVEENQQQVLLVNDDPPPVPVEPQPVLHVEDNPQPVLPVNDDPPPVLVEPQPVLPVGVEPQPVLHVVVEPPPVLHVEDNPQPVLLVNDDPPRVFPVEEDPQPELPVVFNPQPELPVVADPPLVLPIDDQPPELFDPESGAN